MAQSTVSYQLFAKTFYPIILLGAGRYGEAYLAVERDIADELQDESFDIFGDQILAANQWLYAQLRQHLVVVKISNATYEHTDKDLTNEITMLTMLSDAHPGLIHALDYKTEGPAQWLSMPYVTGGDLITFSEEWYDELSIPFIWHVAHGLGSTLLYLHYGVHDTSDPKEMVFHPEWNGLCHDDLHCGNIFLEPVAHSSKGAKPFGNYPNIILADFGRMKYVCRLSLTVATSNPALYHYRDLMNIGDVLTELLEGTGPSPTPLRGSSIKSRDRLLLDWVRKLQAPDPFDRKASHKDLFKLLAEFVEMADHERRVGYKPLSSACVECLEADYVDDEELADIFDVER